MGSFNLGRIKGEKGDRGETGPKGDTGSKGEKGEKGDNGRDGITPVFAIGETVTLSPGEEAYVELDAENPASPTLSFYIPAGQSGKDALGDMLSDIYDTEGVEEDIYKYAQNLVSSCLKLSGGTLSGALKAAETALSDGTVRNISAGSSLSESAAEGDICMVIRDSNSKKLGDCQAGDILLIEEDGTEEPYIVAATDYHADSSVTLIRQYLTSYKGRFNSTKKSSYAMCETDIFLEAMYKSILSEEIRKNLLPVEVDFGVYRHCFLLGKPDFTKIDYLTTESNRIAKRGKTQDAEVYLTSTVNSQGSIVSISTSGSISTTSYLTDTYYRPSIVLPSDLPVINVEYESLPAVKLPETKCGLYVYIQGEWKECAYL